MQVRIVTAEEIKSLLTMSRAIDLMRSAFADLSRDRVDSPVRTMLSNDTGTVLYKPAYSPSENIFCAKVVSVFAGNSERGLPVTPGIIIVNDGDTGLPVALLEAGYLTALRTGAASGLATDLLAATDARTAALFGTGGQAFHQLEAMLCVRELSRVFVFSRTLSNAERFCESAGNHFDCELIPTTARTVLADCDIITTATTSPVPLFEDGEISRHVHINAVGSLGPTRSEIPADTIERATVVVDQRAACLQEAGELLPLMADGRLPADFSPAELGELVLGERTDERQPATVFKSVGNAIQDLVCAAEILQLSDESAGQTIQF